MARIERQIERADAEVLELLKAQEKAAFDAEALIEATKNLEEAQRKREKLEEEWLNISVQLES